MPERNMPYTKVLYLSHMAMSPGYNQKGYICVGKANAKKNFRLNAYNILQKQQNSKI